MIKKVIKQLEGFGYIINKENDYVIAERDEIGQFIITEATTINFSYMSRTNKNGYLRIADYLKYLNDLNVSSLVTTFTSRKKGYLEYSAHYNGAYDVKTFSEFIRAWEYDIDQILSNKETDIFFDRDESGDHLELNENINPSFRAEA
jgi:hypothetical protein